jgi:hypothetical protein
MAIVKSGDPRAFWKWLASHAPELRRKFQDAAHPLLDELRTELHRYCSELYFEIGVARGKRLVPGSVPSGTNALAVQHEETTP